MKKTLSAVLALALVATMVLTSCSKKEKTVEVYFLNFKPEIADVYENVVAPAFAKENPGYTLKVVTAASGGYETTLKSEQAKNNPPVIFQTNGPVGLSNSRDEAADLTNTSFYQLLGDKSMALKLDGYVAAIPYAVEGYGIIYNDAIIRAYCKLPGAVIKSADDIRSFETLKAVAADIQANADKLGIKGAFASTSMSAGNQWRWQTHAVDLPLYYEFKGGNTTSGEACLAAKEISFKYNENFKNLMDLYTTYSTTPKTLLGSKSVDDSMAEFALGQCAFVQNGNWAAAQIMGVPGNKVASADIKFLPIYIGVAGEENQGLCVGTENYLCINKKASAEAQKGADVFLAWLFSSKTGKEIVSNQLLFITPFNSFAENELPADPLSQQVAIWMTKPGITSVEWTFSGIPSEEWKNQFGDAMLQYFEGKASWADVDALAKDVWKSERAIAK